MGGKDGMSAAETQTPITKKLTETELWSEDGTIDLELLKNHLKGEGRLDHVAATRLVNAGADILRKEENLIEVDAPITGM